MMFADDLRKSVLQAAVQGQLTEQLPSDGYALDLLKKIRAEKAKLIKAKKIKPVTFPPISDDELPFKIPPNWCWVRLGEVCQINPRNKILDENISATFLPMPAIGSGYQNIFTPIIKKWTDIKSGFTHFSDGDVIFSKITPCFQNRKSVLLQNLENGIGAGTTELYVLRSYGNYVLGKYLLYFVKSPKFIQDGIATFKGTAGQQRIDGKFVSNYLFPLPPLAEQKRIVDKLDELLKEIELLAADERELDELEKKFPRQMKNSLLQAAIQGQLTKQLPTDGDSRDLLKIIQSEKAKFFKAKKIKPVTLSPISDDDLPFKIPANWCWVRLGDVCTLTKGKKVCVGSLPYLDAKYLRGLKDKVLVDKGIHISQDTRIILVDGENSGEMFEVTEDGYLGSTFQVVELSQNILADYFQYFIMLKKDFYGKNKRGSAIPHLDRQIFFSTLIPLPPIAEQKRIVARLDELLPLCEV